MGQGYGGSYETGGALGDIVDLTTEVIGTLPVANGGTGATSLTDNRVLTGTDTSAITAEANMLFTGTLLTLLDTTQAVIGHTAAVTTGASNTFQVLGTGNADSRALVARFSADAVGPDFDFLKSRHATIASNTIVQDDDVLGRLAYYPADGTNFATLAGVFQCEVDDSSPAVGDVGVAFVWRGMRGAASSIADVMRLSAGGALSPGVNDGTALGTTALMWSDLFLASGAVVNWNNGDVTLTHSTNTLAFAGASSGYTFDALVGPATNDAAALGTATVSWADLFLASGGVINWVNGDVTITHSTNLLAFAGASSGYTFDAVVTPAASDGAALGTSTVMWSDLFLASGAVVNFNNGDVTVTHSTNTLAFAGAASGYTFDAMTGPATNDAAALGTATVSWADLFLASGGVINWVNGDVTITHSTNTLAFGGASSGYTFDAVVTPAASDGAALGTATVMWSDVFLASGAVVNFNNGDVTITHSTNLLAFAGASSGYTFDDAVISSRLETNGTFAAGGGVWSAKIAGATGAARDILIAGQNGFSNGFTVQYDGTDMVFKFANGSILPAANDGGAVGSSALSWADLFLASGAVVNFNNGDVIITHAANNLAFSGSSGATLGYSFDNNVIVGTTAAGATSASTVALSNSATSPTASADLCHLYSLDCAGAGTAALAIYQEDGVRTVVAGASTNSIPVVFNGTTYYLLCTTVRS